MKQGDLFEDDEDWEKEHTHSGSEPETSWDAALDAKRLSGPQMRLVFSFLLRRPMTQDELRIETGLGDNAAKRCSDLHKDGCIQDSGRRGLSLKGKAAVLWEVTEYGRKVYQRGSNDGKNEPEK